VNESEVLTDELQTSEEAPDDLRRQAYGRAIKLLSARDHSRHELRRKLMQRNFTPPVIDAVLEQLGQRGYQSDERFACLLAEQRLASGYGPLAIRAKLGERGVDKSLISDAIDSLEADWQSLAADALRRRFSADELAETSLKQRGRVARFLQSRGFSTSDALRAVASVTE
jgi:regulatory protein